MSDVAILLRGVNVGKAKRISSVELRDAATAAGVSGVRTILNSGNVVGRSQAPPGDLAAAVSAEVMNRCGFTCDVVVRSRVALEHAILRDPLRSLASDPSRHLLIALAERPDASAVRKLKATDVTPDVWELDGEDLHSWMPLGVSSSALQKTLARGLLGVAWTGRNWSSVERIVAAMGT